MIRFPNLLRFPHGKRADQERRSGRPRRVSLASIAVVVVAGVAVLGVSSAFAASADGDGTMTVSPPTATAGSTTNEFTFTFTVPTGSGEGFTSSGSEVTLTVPADWTQPTTTNTTTTQGTTPTTCHLGTTGFTTGSGPWTITVPFNTLSGGCGAGDHFTINYGISGHTVTAPQTAESETFTAASQSGSGGLMNLTNGSPSITVNPAAPAKVVFATAPPSSGTAGSALTSFTASVEDTYGNVETGSNTGHNDTINLSVASGPGAIASGASATASGGVATFSSTVLDTAGSYTFTATDGSRSIATATSTAATVIAPAAPAKVVFATAPPSSGTAGSALTSFAASVEDTYGNVETGSNTGHNDTINLSVASGPGAIASGASATASGGVATFSSTVLDTAGSYTFTATDGSRSIATATSTAATVIAPATTNDQLVFTPATPGPGTAGSAIPNVAVSVEDTYGNVVSSASGSVVMSINVGESPVQLLLGDHRLRLEQRRGQLHQPGGQHGGLLHASPPHRAASAGVSTAVNSNGLHRQPGRAGQGRLHHGTAHDRHRRVRPDLLRRLGRGHLRQRRDRLEHRPRRHDQPERGHAARAPSPRAPRPPPRAGWPPSARRSSTRRAPTRSRPPTVRARSPRPPPLRPRSSHQPHRPRSSSPPAPPSSGTAGSALTSFAASVEDTYGNVETGSNTGHNDTINLSVASGPGAIASGASATASGGVATFSSTVLDTAGSYTFTATDGSRSIATATSTAATVIAPATTNDQLVFFAQPTTTFATVAMPSAVTVQVEDSYGNPVSYSSGAPTVALGISSPGTITSPSPATGVANTSGLATFNGVTAGAAGIGLTLNASAPGMTSATSNAFNVTVLVKNGATLRDVANDGTGSGVQHLTYYYCSGFTTQCTSSNSSWTQISPNSNSSSPYSVTWSGQPADGSYQVVVEGTDNVNNADSTPSTSIPVTVDNSAPAVSVTFPANNGNYNASGWTSTIIGTATDATSGIAGTGSISLTITQSSTGKTWTGSGFATGINTVNPTTYNSGTGAFTYTFPTSNFAGDGTYTVSASAIDAAGNTGASSTATFKYDTIPPTVSVTYPVTSTTYGANWSGTISGTSSDATSGVASTAVAVENTTTGKWWNGTSFSALNQTFGASSGTPTSWTLALAASKLVSGDTFTVIGQATDNAGNVGTSSTNTFIYNTSAPTVAVTYPVSGATYGANWNGAITGTATATAPGATITSGDQVAVKNTTSGLWWGGSSFNQSSQTYVAVTSGTTSWSLTFGAGNLVTGDSYSVVAQATDSASNIGTSSTTTFTYNTSAPTVAVTYPVSGATYGANWNGAITGTATATAPGATITSGDQVAVKNTTTGLWWGGSSFNQSSQTFVAVTSGTTSWSLTFGAGNLVSGDNYSVVAKATDSVGNIGTSSTTTYTYNAIAPSVAIIYPVNNTTYGTNWTGAITGTSTANASGSTISTVKVSIQQGSGSCWTGSGNTYTATCPNYVAVTSGTTNWSLTIPASDFTSGITYHVTAQGTDSYGNTGTSAAVAFTYQGIAHVQDAVTGSGGATSETPTLVNPPTNGNTLILTVGDDGTGSATVSSVSGGGVTSWTKVTSVLGSGSPNLGAAEIWYGLVTCSPCTSSNEGVTVTMSHSTNVQLANVSEWSGIATSSPIDSSTSAAATASGTTFTSGPISLTQTGDLVISDAWLASGFGFSSQPAPPSGYTGLAESLAGGSFYRGLAAYQIDSSSSPISATWTESASGGYYATAIAAFKP